MPLWLIFHPPGSFEDASTKQALTKDITKIYTGIGLPPFYVVANVIKLSTEDVRVGGEMKTKPFIRIVAEHIAVHIQNEDDAYKRTANLFKKALKPHIADKGYDWEFHIDETERRLWRVNGMIPPPLGSDVEQLWTNENKPSAYYGMASTEYSSCSRISHYKSLVELIMRLFLILPAQSYILSYPRTC
ncbi:hypothetical protein EIK77_002254 [Talaromyces pinophilus]|jgi:hypothetical protein|nr:hypothetical protein EIK77_002254 [Talaromyces pinophilus]